MFLRSALLLVLTPLSVGILLGLPVQAPKQNKQPDAVQGIKIEVEMVSLPVVVTTRDGKRIKDLERENFQVFEDGKLQQIAAFAATEEPIDVALALDCSGSTEMRLARIQNEAIRFVNSLYPDDEVAVISFSEDVRLLTDFSMDRKRNAYGIKETRSGGFTVLYEAVWLALEEVLKPQKERTALVLFTDGVDTASHKASMKETLELAAESKSTVYSIYFNTEDDARQVGPRPTVGGIPVPYPPIIVNKTVTPMPGGAGTTSGDYAAGREYLRKLGETTGGLVLDALSMQDLGPAFDEIARELASQYSIGYYPTNTKHDGKFRKVEVKVSKPGLVARTKNGYYARKDTAAKK